ADATKDTVFFAMELLKGTTLENWAAKKGDIEPVDVLRIGREMTIGLAAIHERGLLHRDIKPANLWLEAPNGRVKILDFGLARLAEENIQLTETGMIIGTPAYLSPEQARGGAATSRSDLFSVGCVLYFLCTKKTPFQGKNTMAQLAALVADSPP